MEIQQQVRLELVYNGETHLHLKCINTSLLYDMHYSCVSDFKLGPSRGVCFGVQMLDHSLGLTILAK